MFIVQCRQRQDCYDLDGARYGAVCGGGVAVVVRRRWVNRDKEREGGREGERERGI